MIRRPGTPRLHLWPGPAVLAGIGLACLYGTTSWAVEPVALEASRDYVVGASIVSSADPIGSDGQRLDLRPLWAFQLGRFRVSSGGASRLLSVGRETVDPGLSTVLVTDDGWRLSSSLQITDQREAGDDPLLRGLPEVRMTLRGRATATIALGERWSASFTGSQDLLGRDGGLQLGTAVGYHHPVSEKTYWDASLGAGWANALSRQTQFGISAETALATGRPAYLLGSGWDSVSLGWNITSALNQRWVVFGGLSVSQLQGAAALSPLVGRKTTYGASLGLAYRNR